MMIEEEMASSCTRKGLDWILGKKVLTERVVKHWNRVPRELTELLSQKVFTKHVDMAIKDMV